MRALLETPHAFSFFQVLRLLQSHAGGPKLGHQGPASEEAVRIRPTVSLAFPAADVQSIELLTPPGGARRFRVTTAFMGLYSSDSPLPTFYVEDQFWKESDQAAVRAFVDMFHHRALSLLYRTWEKYRYAIQFERGGEDLFSNRMYCLIGLGTEALRRTPGVPSVRLLRYAGLITQRPHSAASIAGILQDYLDVPGVQIEQCVERWIDVDPAQQNRLGARNATLGRDLVIGSRVRDRAGKFRTTIGPVSLKSFEELLPVSAGYAAMVNLTRFLATDRLDFDVELRLRGSEVPRLRLSTGAPQRLGWTSWVDPTPGVDQSIRLRQPRQQVPQSLFPWPEPSSPAPPAADQDSRQSSRSA
jgi:type VI secretion system protein ImpH